MKFETKLAITWLVQEISPESLHNSSSSSSYVSVTSLGGDVQSYESCLVYCASFLLLAQFNLQ